MAYATSFHLDQHFMRGGLGLNNIFDGQWFFEFAQDGGFHRMYLKELGKRDSGVRGKAAKS
jgi:hypothetical protein